MKTKKQNYINKTMGKMLKTNKAIKQFFQTTKKNYTNMKQKIKKIWLPFAVVILATMQSCNVTRKVTTESSYHQKGDTTCTIITKTIETYDATKKGF